MKTDNEMKARFFALYWGQKVCKNSILDGRFIGWVNDGYYSDASLELKPLSQISDEDAIGVAKLSGKCRHDEHFEVFENSFGNKVVSWGDSPNHKRVIKDKWLSFPEIDKARSLGYAINYMGISVDEQIEKGWIKLT